MSAKDHDSALALGLQRVLLQAGEGSDELLKHELVVVLRQSLNENGLRLLNNLLPQ